MTERKAEENEEVKLEDIEKKGAEMSGTFKKVLYSAGAGKSLSRKINTPFKNGQVRF